MYLGHECEVCLERELLTRHRLCSGRLQLLLQAPQAPQVAEEMVSGGDQWAGQRVGVPKCHRLLAFP